MPTLEELHEAEESVLKGILGSVTDEATAITAAPDALEDEVPALLELTASGTYTDTEVQSIADKVDEIQAFLVALNDKVEEIRAAGNQTFMTAIKAKLNALLDALQAAKFTTNS